MFAILEVKTESKIYLTREEKKKKPNFFVVSTNQLFEIKKSSKNKDPNRLNVKKINNNEFYYYWLKRYCRDDCELSEKDSDQEDEYRPDHDHRKVLQVYISDLHSK